MIEESKCCADMMKKYFNEKLVMAKADDEDFETFTKIGFVIMLMLRVMLK